MNALPRNISSTPSQLPLFIILGMIVMSTLVLAGSLSSLHVGPGAPGYSAAALFNQANAEAQQGKTGQAIANYERARLLAPTDPDIAANLHWVRQHAGLPDASTNWLERSVSWASPNTLALVGWMGLVLTGTGILSAQSFMRFRISSRLAACVGIILLSFSVVSAIGVWQKGREAIVTPPEISARISPVTNGETAFKLHAGETVYVAGQYHDFTLVRNSAGHSGWVAQSEITPLIPK